MLTDLREEIQSFPTTLYIYVFKHDLSVHS